MLGAIANTFANCFKIPELKSRIIFTVLLLGICRLMAWITIPGLDGGKIPPRVLLQPGQPFEKNDFPFLSR